MSDAIKEIAKACLAFEGKESAPPVAGSYLFFLKLQILPVIRTLSVLHVSSS